MIANSLKNDLLKELKKTRTERNTPASIDAGSTASEREGFVFMAAMPYLCTVLIQNDMNLRDIKKGLKE